MLRNLGEQGGIVVYATNLLKNLFEIDSENEYLLIYRDAKDLGYFGDRPNLKEIVVSAPNKLWWDQISVPRVAKNEQLDLIFNPKLSIPLLTRRKTVWVMHGGAQFTVPHAFKLSDRIYFTIANRLYAKKASAIITMTHIGANDIVRCMGADPEKMNVIYEAYNERCRVMKKEETNAVHKKYSLPEKYILFVGGLTPLKNFGNLLRAYKRVQNIIPHHLVVIGWKRWKFSQDLRVMDELGLSDRVLFKGFVPDEEIPSFYNRAALFAFPSIYEGFGIPALEAMACGCPVIASKTGCSPEVVGDAAVLVDPQDPGMIAAAIRDAIEDSGLRRQLIDAGLKRAKKFSWRKCARQTLSVFDSLK
jgi:glycosyltransferase involved in cell wall biosynthesis